MNSYVSSWLPPSNARIILCATFQATFVFHIPGGDVPSDTGVCTDEVIRSYRAVGIDLQKEVHEDMVRDFDAYPHQHQRFPDSNIDHRRVPN